MINAAWQVAPLWAEDWPTLRRDERRSGVAVEQLPVERLALAWTHRPLQAPRPAWPGPARWDAYVKRSLISSMRNYDESFHVTISGGRLYFGSSADDSVHCLDAQSGEELWHYTVGGPVRFPPAIAKGMLYFGSDDGYLYCLSLARRELAWKFKPSPPRLLLNDGRLISQWPIRTAVLVKDNIVYAGASLLPWEKSYLCAVAAETGETGGPGTYVSQLDLATLEGSILADQDQLIVPQGRAAPIWLTRSTGQSRGLIPGVHGGSFALIAADGSRFFGPGPREGFISEANASHTSAIARKFGATALVADQGKLFVLERKVLGCMRQQPEEWLWRNPSDLEEALILTGDALIAGGNGKVAAFHTANGRPLWQAAVEGRAQGLAIANGSLYVSTDEGVIHAFRVNAESARQPAPAEPYRVAAPLSYDPLPTTRLPNAIRRGPMIRFTGPRTALVAWDTATPTATTLVHGIAGFDARHHDPVAGLHHEVELRDLRKNAVYRCAILLPDGAEGEVAGPFECDTHMNFLPPTSNASVIPLPDKNKTEPQANALLAQLEHSAGICLAIGGDVFPLAGAVTQRSQLNAILVERDPTRAAKTRAPLFRTGLYGTRLAVLGVDNYENLHAPGNFANLALISSAALNQGGVALAHELSRVLCPRSGRLFVISPAAESAEQDLARLKAWLPDHRCTAWPTGVLVAKPETPGIGAWTHQYGLADNAAYANETLGNASRTTDFEVQWLGRPGPRFQSDRGNRKPAPLYSAGRLFAQGLDRMLAMDARNGTVLWSLEIPDSRRFNIRNDSANWCADDDRVFLAVRDACWAIDARNGKLLREYLVPRSDFGSDWGYVGRQSNLLIGSQVPQQASYQEFWGGEFWYVNSEGPLAAKVCGSALFAHDAASGEKVWQYQSGAIVNTSIALTADSVIFVESRRPDIVRPDQGRYAQPEFWADLHLVSLSLADGKIRWQKKIEMGLGTTMFSLACGPEHVTALASAKGDYRLNVFRRDDGTLVWKTAFPWESNGKGGDSARPAIIGDALYVSPRAFELATGAPLPLKLTRGACGSYAAASNVFLTRLGNLGLWDPTANVATTWERLRPDCWLSAIPAGGLILAPEGGGGCSCGGWIETSLAFAPRRVKPAAPAPAAGK